MVAVTGNGFCSATIMSLEIAGVGGDFRIGDWSVSPALNQVSRDGNCTRLEPKAMQVLVYLAENPGVVSKNQLISAVPRQGDTARS